MNYFTPGVPYIFRSLGTTSTNVITIVFDAAANASITISQETVLPNDKKAIYLFAPTSDYLMNPITSEIEITEDLNKFWYIYFDNPNHKFDNATVAKDEPKKQLVVSCTCKTAGVCKINPSIEGDMVCIDCIVSGECEECNEPKWSKTMNVDCMSVLIKAESITIQ